MIDISDDQSELLVGGLSIAVSPTISVGIINALQTNTGVAVGVGALGDGVAGVLQGNGLGLSSYLGSLPSLPV